MENTNTHLKTGTVEFGRYPAELKLQVDNYVFNPVDWNHFQTAVTALQNLYEPTNCYHGRGFVQVVAGNIVKLEKIYDSSQFHLGLLKHMLFDHIGTRGPGTAGLAWGYTKVVITLCREYFPNSTLTPPTRLLTVNPDEEVMTLSCSKKSE
jgi:hypothetical protein